LTARSSQFRCRLSRWFGVVILGKLDHKSADGSSDSLELLWPQYAAFGIGGGKLQALDDDLFAFGMLAGAAIAAWIMPPS
jgi:hypothetical protein